MFAKLKKKIAEEAATAPRTGVRIPRTISRESIASGGGADSGDDFASDGSSSRDDLPTQLLRRNDQIRKLEAKLSDYAEQLRIMQKTKEKLEVALEKLQDSSIKKLQDQNESHQASRARLADGMALALEKKEQEWMEKMTDVEKEKASLSARVEDMMEQSVALFQKRDDLDELEGFQQQEMAKVKHMLLKEEQQLSRRDLELQQKEAEVQRSRRALQESRSLNAELEVEREELLLLREEAELKIGELQAVVQQVSEDFQKSQRTASTLEEALEELQAERDALKLQQQKVRTPSRDVCRSLLDLQRKVSSLDRRLQENLSPEQHLQELLQEKCILETSLEETRAELLQVRTNHHDTVSSLETQVSRLSCSVSELQTLLRHKDDSSRSYKERTDTQISNLEQSVLDGAARTKSAERQLSETLQQEDRQRASLEQQSQEEARRLEETISSLQGETQRLQDAMVDLEQQRLLGASRLSQRTEQLEQSRVELSSQQTVSTEIAKALEESRRQKEDLQTRVVEMTSSLQTSQQQLALAEENATALQNEVQSLQASLGQLQEEAELQRVLMEQVELDRDAQLSRLRDEKLTHTQQLDGCQARVSYLEVEVETLTEQLHSPEVCEQDQNGSVAPEDLDHIQKVNRELEQQLADKNRIIKQLQQRLAELKRTLQKELKLKPEPEAEGKEKFPEGRADKPERVGPDPQMPPASSAMSPPTSSTLVTNTSDLNDSREINFEYLKHVVLKFMSSREAEAFQLIRAVSVLLNFSREEEDMLKQTLEYKMSWFGSKPSPKGAIRPSVSGSSSQWG
ncbi:golgin subfamily A member 1 [Pseudoliparis swirei]|uniref:golgin subfamily A member 1 n=1 Tax=Pseudoliparis swirei TaxID=2059687 RepID=UPI0024BDDF49|nr:golgin subfamily A member 1 [Pseudoliparis swirei]